MPHLVDKPEVASKAKKKIEKITMVLSPLTGSHKVDLVCKISTIEIIQEWKSRYEIDVSEEFGNINTIRLYRCQESKLNFFMPLSVAASDRLYQLLERFDWYYMEDKWEYEMALRDLHGYKRVLEVGCGKGAFIERLIERGKFDVLGIELNERAVSRALKKGLPVAKTEIDNLNEPGNFDAVCMFQVLEHIPQPKRFIEKILQNLKTGGVMIFSVPNADSFLKDSKLNILDMPPHHMTRWSTHTISYLQHLFPVKILKVRKEPLAQYHANWYALVQLAKLRRLMKNGGPTHKKCVNLLSKIMYHSAFLRRLIIGHTLYACVTKV